MNSELHNLRKSIDNIDSAMVLLLAERFRITAQVGEYKKLHQLPPADLSREADQESHLKQLASESGLDPEFALKYLELVRSEVKRLHAALQAKN